MAEYYEKETLLDFVKKYTPTFGDTTTMQCVIRAIEHAPTTNDVEVVRCKDCVFCKCIEDSGNHKCTTFNGRFGTVKPDDFCSYGERRCNAK